MITPAEIYRYHDMTRSTVTGRRLKNRRICKGIRPKEVARQTCVTPSLYTSFERQSGSIPNWFIESVSAA